MVPLFSEGLPLSLLVKLFPLCWADTPIPQQCLLSPLMLVVENGVVAGLCTEGGGDCHLGCPPCGP